MHSASAHGLPGPGAVDVNGAMGGERSPLLAATKQFDSTTHPQPQRDQRQQTADLTPRSNLERSRILVFFDALPDRYASQTVIEDDKRHGHASRELGAAAGYQRIDDELLDHPSLAMDGNIDRGSMSRDAGITWEDITDWNEDAAVFAVLDPDSHLPSSPIDSGGSADDDDHGRAGTGSQGRLLHSVC